MIFRPIFVATLLIAPALKAQTIIDEFSAGGTQAIGTGGSGIAGARSPLPPNPTADAVGDTRIGYSESLSGGSVTVSAGFSGVLQVAASGATVPNGSIVWDGTSGASLSTTADPTAFGLALDLSGEDAFVLKDFSSSFSAGATLADLRIQMFVYSDATNWYSSAAVTPATAQEDVEIPFSSFTPSAGSPSWGNVGAIKLEIKIASTVPANEQINFSIATTQIAAVPEPGGVIFIVMAGMVMAFRRRRYTGAHQDV